jgi:hypothetical protein
MSPPRRAPYAGPRVVPLSAPMISIPATKTGIASANGGASSQSASSTPTHA